MEMPNRELFGTYQAGLILGVTPQTVRRWVQSGQIKGGFIGSRIRITRKAIDDLMAKAKTPRRREARK